MESKSKQESSRPKLTTVLVNKANDKPKAKSDLPKQKQQHNNINKNRRRRLRSRFGMKPVVTVRPFSVNGHELPANIGEADRSRLIRRLQLRRERRAEEEEEGRGFLQHHHQQTALRAAEQRFREEFWAHMHRQQVQLNRELQEAAGPTTTTNNNNNTTTTTPTPTPTPTITTTVELGGDVVVFEEVETADGDEEAFFRALNRG
ncbi:hypothetical protein TYRP_001604 [Tyrophagus putrescentiae]|nr:hypothetical protein TYRP_001604 [Tyrophagus putrescentiae]